jgi:cobalt-precorrin-5B (C1)-methyltransferase
MTDNFVVKKGKKLRYGYTTGTCAAGAAKASVQMLFEKRIIKKVDVDTPKGWNLHLLVRDIDITDTYALCGVKKDAGDDPDVTDGIIIYAKAVKNNDNNIVIKGGVGIGLVTKKGLSVEIGKPAITPVPMKMIIDEIKKVKPKEEGVIVEISAPEGIEIAKKTFNPKLGIIGGISILGTTGIVEPMSQEALKESLSLKISVLKGQGMLSLVFVPGNYGERFATQTLKISKERIVKTSNYIGYMLEQAKYYGIKDILLVGHIGKLSKIAGGIFNTHSRIADARFEILASHYAKYSGDIDTLRKIMESNTTEDAIVYVQNNDFFNYLADLIAAKCMDYIDNEITIEIVIFSQAKGMLGMSQKAKSLIDKIKSREELNE